MRFFKDNPGEITQDQSDYEQIIKQLTFVTHHQLIANPNFQINISCQIIF
jgi:hypothetical protein